MGVNTPLSCKLIPGSHPRSFLAEIIIYNIPHKCIRLSEKSAKADVSDQAIQTIMLKQKAVEENKQLAPEDDVSVVTLVGYAIHKLFSDWESGGFCLKCAGSRSKDSTDYCSCVAGQSRTQWQALAAITAPYRGTDRMDDENEKDESNSLC